MRGGRTERGRKDGEREGGREAELQVSTKAEERERERGVWQWWAGCPRDARPSAFPPRDGRRGGRASSIIGGRVRGRAFHLAKQPFKAKGSAEQTRVDSPSFTAVTYLSLDTAKCG